MSDFECHPIGTASKLAWVDKELFRRVRVENQLWLVVQGKRPPPTVEECREWALTLGVPDEMRSAIK